MTTSPKTSWKVLTLAVTIVLAVVHLPEVDSAVLTFSTGSWADGSINSLSGTVEILFDDDNGKFSLKLSDTSATEVTDDVKNLGLYISGPGNDAPTPFGVKIPIEGTANGNLVLPLPLTTNTSIPHSAYPESVSTLFAYEATTGLLWGHAELSLEDAGRSAYSAYLTNDRSVDGAPVLRGTKGYNTLYAAMTNDQSGPIKLATGAVLSGAGNSDLLISSDIIIEQQGGMYDPRPFIDLDYRGTLFYVASSTSPHIILRGIGIRHGSAPIGADSGHLEMKNIVIENFHSSCVKHSGALTINKRNETTEVSSNNFFQSYIMGCGYTSKEKTTAVEMGGGIHILSTTTPLSITLLYFSRNVAVNGGAMYMGRAIKEGEISRNIYDTNTALNKGGAIYTDHDLWLNDEKTFGMNTAGGGGSGIYVGGNLTMLSTLSTQTQFYNVADDSKSPEGISILCRGKAVNIVNAMFKRPQYNLPVQDTVASSNVKIEPIPLAAVDITLRRVDFWGVGTTPTSQPPIMDGPLVVIGEKITSSLEGCSWNDTSGWYSSSAVISSSESTSLVSGSGGTITIKKDRFVSSFRGSQDRYKTRFSGKIDTSGMISSIVGGLYLKGRFTLNISGWESGIPSELLCGTSTISSSSVSSSNTASVLPGHITLMTPFIAIEGCPNKQKPSIVLVKDVPCSYSSPDGKDVCDLPSQ